MLGIETSCDDTAVSIVTHDAKILANRVVNQNEHSLFGGVVPEIASRAHFDCLDLIVKQVMKEAGVGFSDISTVAATGGPGLIGGLIVGIMTAKAISSSSNIPFMAINHLEAHALTARLTFNSLEFPFLLFILSGGHCQILLAEEVGHYTLIGNTIDDSIGESFDKVAKMLNLGYPGGPIVEKLAKSGNEHRFKLPQPLITSKHLDRFNAENCDFSFSGLKTAVRNIVYSNSLTMDESTVSDICASFQCTVASILVNRLKKSFSIAKKIHPSICKAVICGGVASNKYIINKMSVASSELNCPVYSPPIGLCTDNAAMVAWAAIERIKKGFKVDNMYFVPKPRWPLTKAA